MKYDIEKPKRRRFTEQRGAKHFDKLWEFHEEADKSVAHAPRRAEMLKAKKLFEVKQERDRANAASFYLPPNQHDNLQCFWVSKVTR